MQMLNANVLDDTIVSIVSKSKRFQSSTLIKKKISGIVLKKIFLAL
jgi:hypothetical protein